MRRATILVLAAAQFIMVVDTTVMNVSISNVVSDLKTTVPAVQAAITVYALVMAAFMLTGAKAGDMWGRRRAFAAGLVLYGTGSLITAFSPNVTVLLIGWSFIEGFGAVLVIPAIAALTAVNYEGTERALAYGILGGVAGAAAAAGPLIGGFVTAAWTWRVVFASETAIVIVLLAFVSKVRDAPAEEGLRLDLLGATLSAIGMGLVVFGILKIPEWGFIEPVGALTIAGTEITPFGFSVVPFLILGGIAVLMWFASAERRISDRGGAPLLRPEMLRIAQLRAGSAMVGAQQLIIAGTLFVLPLYLQLVLGMDALQTGVRLLPISVAMMLAALAGPSFAKRRSPRLLVRVGLVLLFAGLLGTMATIGPKLSGASFLLSLTGVGLGLGLIVSQLGNVVMSSVEEERVSEAGGIQGTVQYFGSSLGTALIGAVLLAGLTTGFHQSIQADPSVPPEISQQIVKETESGLAMVSLATVEARAKQANLPADTEAALIGAYSDAQIAALKESLLWAAAFALVAVWFAKRLPSKPLGEREAASERTDAVQASPLGSGDAVT